MESRKSQEEYPLWLNSYSFTHAAKVAAVIYEKKPAIIHVHGDINNIVMDDFVFTSQDYTRIKKKYPGFNLALYSLLINYSTLFVGYGSSDPHLEELMEDLSYYFKDETYFSKNRHFLLIRKNKVDTILEKYKDKIKTDIIEVDDYDQTSDFLEQLQKLSPRLK